MRRTGLIIVGAVIIVAGLALLLGAVLDVSPGVFCLPAALILLGIYILVRPRLVAPNTGWGITLFGPVRRDGVWQVTDLEQWLFVGDVRLDFTQANVPVGETCIRVFAFVGDVRLRAPESLGVSVVSTAFVTTIKGPDFKRDGFVVPMRYSSEGYDTADRRIRLETVCFVSDVKIQHA